MTTRVNWANTLRGLAACSVVVGHFGVTFWMFQEITSTIGRQRPLYPGDTGQPRTAAVLGSIPVDFGALGVATFFVLSGFVVGLSLHRYGRTAFAVNRLLRILPTFIVGQVLVYVLIAASGDPYAEWDVAALGVGLVPGLDFLVGIRAPSTGVTWTLLIELMFYGVCVVLSRRLVEKWQAIVAVAAAAAAIQLLVPAPVGLLGSSRGGAAYLLLLLAPFLPVLLLGVTLAARTRGLLHRRAAVGLISALLVEHVLLLATSPLIPFSVVYSATFAGTIALVVIVWARHPRHFTFSGSSWLADISYPLYVVHAPLGYALLAVLVNAGLPPVLAIASALVLSLGVATAVHVVVERPTHRLGRRWARALDARALPSAPQARASMTTAPVEPAPVTTAPVSTIPASATSTT